MNNWKKKRGQGFNYCKRVMFLFSFALLLSGIFTQQAEAAPTNKTQVNKEIKKVKKQIKKLKKSRKKLKKQYKKVQKKANADLKGTDNLILAEKEIGSAKIVWNSVNSSYYYLTNVKASDFNYGYFSGSVKVTGRRRVDGYLCKIGKIIRSKASDKAYNMIKKYEKQGKKLENAEYKLWKLKVALKYSLEM